MANLYDYIKEYGKNDFDKTPLNDIDHMVFCSMAYVDLKPFMPRKRFESITLEELGKRYFYKFSKKDHRYNIAAQVNGIKTFKAIYKMKRYKDIEIYNYRSKENDSKQFCAMTMRFHGYTYVLFEGTNHLLSGWEEDFKMSYSFPVPSHKESIRYLNRAIRRGDENIIVCGHSKGGNLALVSSMYCHEYIKRRIKKIYNLDGPGLREKQFNTNRYKEISDRLVSIVPNYSVIGTLLKTEEYKVVKSPRVTIMSHDLATWEVKGTHIVKTKLSKFSEKFDNYMDDFVKINGDKMMKKYVKVIFGLLREAGIDSLEKINAAKLKGTIKLIKVTQEFDEDTKKMAIDFMNFMLKNYSMAAYDKIKKMIPKAKKDKVRV